ncbi:MAG: hypothetical protein KAJ47_00590 [Candidatus Aenigmarchaeota archaeon]|nr:hypothetical protein [Candidatus Aenigmarchaeota archaeon]
MRPLCAMCKGRNLCGIKVCPLVPKMKILEADIVRSGRDQLFGSSPPSIFVGRYGYPKVYVGGLAPIESGDTSFYDDPIMWARKKKSIEEIFGFRSSLVNSRSVVDIKKGGTFLEDLQEIAMAKRPVDMEVKYKKHIHADITFSDMSPVQGPSGEIKTLDLCGNVKVDRKVDKTITDSDLKTVDAVRYLYKHKINENKIVNLIAGGLLGVERKLVPTRWSITAIDDTIAQGFMQEIRRYDKISEYRVFSYEYLGNHFEIILMPYHLSFEVIEAVMSGGNDNIRMICDSEEFGGRKNYASNVAGGYYAARMPVVEYLNRIRKQASILIMREIKPQYYMPLGVWVVRECVKEAMRQGSSKFSTLDEAISYAGSRLSIPIDKFKTKSVIIKRIRTQRNLTNFSISP